MSIPSMLYEFRELVHNLSGFVVLLLQVDGVSVPLLVAIAENGPPQPQMFDVWSLHFDLFYEGAYNFSSSRKG